MADDTKSLKNRIKSVDSTYKIAKAMELVASAKIRGATEKMNRAKAYLDGYLDILRGISVDPTFKKSPYVQKKEGGKNVIIVVAGDRGLAGGYNSNIFRLLDEHKDARVIPIGKRASEKYPGSVLKAEKFEFQDAKKIAEELCDDFKEGRLESVRIVFTKYISMLERVVVCEDLLPLKIPKGAKHGDILYEPEPSLLFESIINRYLAAKIFEAVKEGFLSELASRRLAMESATKNASDMREDLKLRYNRARQGAITREITEIVAGSEN